MYSALAASTIFPDVNTVTYRAASHRGSSRVSADFGLTSGYDPSTGIRVLVRGSAVAQVVPLGDFLAAGNEQIYNPDPEIVPIVTALVYDVRENNALGATTFTLPVYYTRDEIDGSDYVSRISAKTAVNGTTVNGGQTALFPGGPGYDDERAFELRLAGSAILDGGAPTGTLYTFDRATVVSHMPVPPIPRVEVGVTALTYSGGSPAAIFANQRIVGFYRDASWKTCLGVPIYDYGPANDSFTNTTAPVATPDLIYGPSDEFLSGGTLQNVLTKLEQATYVVSAERCLALLDGAIAEPDTSEGAGLAVTTAGLDFRMTSPGAAPIVDNLSVPILATVTNTPEQTLAAEAAPDVAVVSNGRTNAPAIGRLVPIGAGANRPVPRTTEPTTIEVALTASVPHVVLAQTGITSVELGTVFPQQAIGSAAAFAADFPGLVLNLAATGEAPLAPFEVTLAETGIEFSAGVTYTFSLEGAALSVSGSDGSSATATLAQAAEAGITYVGMAVYRSALTQASAVSASRADLSGAGRGCGRRAAGGGVLGSPHLRHARVQLRHHRRHGDDRKHRAERADTHARGGCHAS